MGKKKWNKALILKEIKNLKTNLQRKPVKRDNSNLYGLTRKFFGSWNNALKEAGFEIKERQSVKIPTKLSGDLAYFLGLLITDGHIVIDYENKKYKVMLFNSYPEERKIIISLVKKLFDYEPKLRAKKYGFNRLINYEIYIPSKELAEFLVYKYKIPSGAKSKIVRVPRFFFKSPRKIIANFVRGVIDGDGSVSKNCISLSSGSYLFLKDIIRLVSIFGIRFRDIKKNDSQKYLTFDIRLYGKENAANFYSLLYEDANFFYPRKKRVWEGLKNKIS